MPYDIRPPHPRRTEGGVIDTDYYIRRAHRLRSHDICDAARRSWRAVLRRLFARR